MARCKVCGLEMLMTDEVFKSILAIRDSGASNMFDLHTVQCLAYEQEMYELVTYIEEHPRAYFHFIMYGTEE